MQRKVSKIEVDNMATVFPECGICWNHFRATKPPGCLAEGCFLPVSESIYRHNVHFLRLDTCAYLCFFSKRLFFVQGPLFVRVVVCECLYYSLVCVQVWALFSVCKTFISNIGCCAVGAVRVDSSGQEEERRAQPIKSPAISCWAKMSLFQLNRNYSKRKKTGLNGKNLPSI